MSVLYELDELHKLDRYDAQSHLQAKHGPASPKRDDGVEEVSVRGGRRGKRHRLLHNGQGRSHCRRLVTPIHRATSTPTAAPDPLHSAPSKPGCLPGEKDWISSMVSLHGKSSAAISHAGRFGYKGMTTVDAWLCCGEHECDVYPADKLVARPDRWDLAQRHPLGGCQSARPALQMAGHTGSVTWWHSLSSMRGLGCSWRLSVFSTPASPAAPLLRISSSLRTCFGP
jgi:hypothetical protein